MYGGWGKYELQLLERAGQQGEFYDVGIQGAYAHRIGRSLRMEYTLGLGYMRRDYKRYHKVDNTEYGDIKVVDYPWDSRRANWVGPTNVKVSLVWLIHYKTIKK